MTTEIAALKSLGNPGELWQHHKGGLYRIVEVVFEESSGRAGIAYRSLETKTVWWRPLDDFMALVKRPSGPAIPRFVFVPETE